LITSPWWIGILETLNYFNRGQFGSTGKRGWSNGQKVAFQGKRGCNMIRYALIALSISVFLGFGKFTFALDEKDGTGLTPDQLQEFKNNQNKTDTQKDRELIKELNRRRDDPYWNCVVVGSITGKDMYEVKSISIKLGATNVQWTNVITDSASGIAYRCPAQ
jgi:hypothetical protein